MTIKPDQFSSSSNSPSFGSAIRVMDFAPLNDVVTNSIVFKEIGCGDEKAYSLFYVSTYGKYLFFIDLDTVTSGATNTKVEFRIIIDKGSVDEQIISPNIGYWSLFHTTVNIHRQFSFTSPPIDLTLGSHSVSLEWRVSNPAALAKVTGNHSYIYINALSGGFSGS